MTELVESRPLPSANNWDGRKGSVGAAPGFVISVVLVAAVAVLDFVTGYEFRLAPLYLLPVALSTWTGGSKAGMAIVIVASLCWLFTFHSTHAYSREIFFLWEGLATFAVYVLIVWLLARLRAALRRADERFLCVLEQLHAGVYVVDHDRGLILYANRRLASLIDADPSSISAFGLEERFGAALRGRPAEQIPAWLRGKTRFVTGEVRDPSTGRWFLVQAGPVPWSRHRDVSLKVITDISEQKHAQALKQQHRDMLHETARLAALTEIGSALAHEINQPLMAIASYTDACLRLLHRPEGNQADVVTALEKCRRQAVRAGQVISRMRDFISSRHPQPRACDINAIVRESLDLADIQIERARISVETRLAESLPLARADPTLLAQVVMNLLQNGIEAMRGFAPIWQTLTVATSVHADGSILVSVSDRGQGLPEGVGDAVYRPFFTTKPQGLGLGLSICRSVIEAHGGRLWHEVNQESGCTFHFTVPRGNHA
jgi:C4-dicarboxylate-specific signal transduction histidine kinase